MNEFEIDCDCGRRGVLLLEGGAGYVRHPAGTANCPLPPRDAPAPAEPEVERPTWVEFYGRVAS